MTHSSPLPPIGGAFDSPESPLQRLSDIALDLAAVRRYTVPYLAGVRNVPVLGSPEWCALDDFDRRKHAALVVAALSRLALPADVVGDLERDAEARTLKRVSNDISGAEDWHRIAAAPTWAELDRRRAQPGPVHHVDRAAMRRWVATGSSRPDDGRNAA